jgi:antitoxin (DNA-binding transcriptional repressor) of toxin-antitoxin stability system
MTQRWPPDMETIRTQPAEVTATEFRQNIARIIRDAEYGRPTVITRDRIPVAKVVHPDAANMPHPDLWQAAQEAYDKAITTALVGAHPSVGRALKAFGELLGAHFGYDQPASVKTCVRCGAAINATGTRWIDAEGWDHCPDSNDSHQPAKEMP